ADLPEQVNLPFRVPRTSQVDDGPRADVLFEPGNVGVVHLVERRASKQPPPRDGAAVVRPVAAKVSEVGDRFEMDVPWIRLAHTRLHHDARALTIMRSSLSTRIAGEDDGRPLIVLGGPIHPDALALLETEARARCFACCAA